MQSTSDLFNQAVEVASNLEMDWLWLAGQLSNKTEIEYCFKQALYINPQSVTAARELALLQCPPISQTSNTQFNGLRGLTRRLHPSR